MISYIVEFLHAAWNIITHSLSAMRVLVLTVFQVPPFILSILTYFPAFITTAIVCSISVLVIKLVIGR